MNVTESEILSLLHQTFRIAAEHCDALAVLPARGPTYRALCRELQTAENCCRQVAYYRQDTRWLTFGMYMEGAHKRAGNWLRDRSMPRTHNSNLAHPLFVKLAENLRYGLERVEELQNKKTGIVGMILPAVKPAPTRTSGRLIQVRRSHGSLILPPGYEAAA